MLPVLAAGDQLPFTWLAELLPFLKDGSFHTLLFAHSCLAAVIILTLAWVARMAMIDIMNPTTRGQGLPKELFWVPDGMKHRDLSYGLCVFGHMSRQIKRKNVSCLSNFSE